MSGDLPAWQPASTTDLPGRCGLFWLLLDSWLILVTVTKPALLFVLGCCGDAAPAGLAVMPSAWLGFCGWLVCSRPPAALVGRGQCLQPLGCEPEPSTGVFHSPRELQGICRLVIQMEENRAHKNQVFSNLNQKTHLFWWERLYPIVDTITNGFFETTAYFCKPLQISETVL